MVRLSRGAMASCEVSLDQDIQFVVGVRDKVLVGWKITTGTPVYLLRFI